MYEDLLDRTCTQNIQSLQQIFKISNFKISWDLRFQQRFQRGCTRFQGVADPLDFYPLASEISGQFPEHIFHSKLSHPIYVSRGEGVMMGQAINRYWQKYDKDFQHACATTHH